MLNQEDEERFAREADKLADRKRKRIEKKTQKERERSQSTERAQPQPNVLDMLFRNVQDRARADWEIPEMVLDEQAAAALLED